MIRLLGKLRDLARVERALWTSRDMTLAQKVQFAVSRLGVLAGAHSVSWLGHRMRSDNPLGLLLLPEYMHEARRLASVVGITTRDVVVDVGGNIGQFATSLAAVTGCNVISIEANPQIASLLRANTSTYPSITVVEAAVGACSETKIYYSVPGKSAQGSFDPIRAAENLSAALDAKPLSVVQLRTVLDHVGLHGKRIACIKIDTEGTELDVLAGCSDLSVDAFQVEIDMREPERNSQIKATVGALLGHQPRMLLDPNAEGAVLQNAIFISSRCTESRSSTLH